MARLLIVWTILAFKWGISESKEKISSVKSGRELFHLEIGDSKYWYFTKTSFGALRCIDALSIDSMDPLTGAEDIQILYSTCDNNYKWKIIHYSNRGSHFSLITSILAANVAVVYNENLPIVDVRFHTCNDLQPHIPSVDCHKNKKSSKKHKHPLRHHFHHRKKKKRAKREAIGGNLKSDMRLFKSRSPYEVQSDIIVPEGSTITIDAGVQLKFSANVGLNVKGRLVARGTKEEPIQMVPAVPSGFWAGISLKENYQMFDVRLIQSQNGSEGVVQVYDYDLKRWRLVCGKDWNRRAAHVTCRQLGYKLGASADNLSLENRSLPSGDFWITSVACIGTEERIDQCRRSSSVECKFPPAAVRCQGPPQMETTKPSLLEYVNCSGTLNGIEIIGRLPRLSHVTSHNSKRHGMNIITHYDSRHVYDPIITNVQLANNRLSGLRLEIDYPSGFVGLAKNPKFTISDSIFASNREDGLTLRGRGTISIERSSFFGNAQDGINSLLSDGGVTFKKCLSASNSRYSFQFFRDNSQFPLQITMDYCNITGHWWGPAILVNTGQNTKLSIESSQFWQNYNGGILFGGLGESDVKILKNNFTRNRGRILYFIEVRNETTINLDRNQISLNLLSNYSARQSVIGFNLAAGDQSGTEIRLTNNAIFKNTMENALLLRDSRLAPATAYTFKAEHNSFKSNLAPDIVMIDALNANLLHNLFNNPGSICELRVGLFRPEARISAPNNYWGKTDHNEVSTRICDFSKDSSLMSANYLPFMLNDKMTRPAPVDPPITGKKGELGGVLEGKAIVLTENEGPYHVMQSVLIGPESTLTIGQGTKLIFKNGRGLRVKGKLVIQGTASKPVTLTGDAQDTWNGIVFDNKNSPSDSVLSHCVIENTIDALTLHSDRAQISNCVVSRPTQIGIVIGALGGRSLDFGNSTIVRSQGRGIHVQYRTNGIEIKNIKILDSDTIGMDFEQPYNDIMIKNVEISNSGQYGIKIDQARLGSPTIDIEGLKVTNHVRGKAGLLINARDYRQINIRNSEFTQNSVPSVDLALRCNYSTETASHMIPDFNMKNNRFSENLNIVAAISLLYCVRANISSNEFSRNNRDFRFGALKISMEPSKNLDHFSLTLRANVFIGNQGAYTVYLLPLTMYNFKGNFTRNIMKDNQNRRSSVIFGSPIFVAKFNEFENPYSTYDLEVEYNDDKILEARENYWGTNDDKKVKRRILDGDIIVTRGLVNYKPFLTRDKPDSEGDCTDLNDCSNHGRCVGDNVCSCDSGYSGSNCGSFNCKDVFDCNQNGVCIGPNVCKCFEGWSGDHCSIASCSHVNNCNNHGQCISLNECKCYEGYTGSDCSLVSCFPHNCTGQGKCISANQCQCEPGWSGDQCSLADCSSTNDCSGHGVCVSPNICDCEIGYIGIDCSQCQTNNCDHMKCDFQCVYGKCDTVTGSCVCNSGWSGAACDVCIAQNECNVKPQLDYVLPLSGPTNAAEDFKVFAHGKNFESTPNNVYECSFGQLTSSGVWITNELISCSAPEGATSGKVVFTIHPENKQKPAVPSLNGVHYFTFYEACQANSCGGPEKGICFEGICNCLSIYKGNLCEQEGKLPKIDSTTLPVIAQEGKPFRFQLKTFQSEPNATVTWTKVKGPDNLIIEQSGLVTWSNPIGSSDPIDIQIQVHSLYGSDTVKWSLNVPITYKPEINNIVQSRNFLNVDGRVTGVKIDEIPIKLLLFKNGKLERQIDATAKNGIFDADVFARPEDAGVYQVIVVHPGQNITTLTTPNLSEAKTWTLDAFEIVPEQDVITYYDTDTIEAIFLIKNTGGTVLSGFRIELINPKESIELQSVDFKDSLGTWTSNFQLGNSAGNVTATVSLRLFDKHFRGKTAFRATTVEGLTKTVDLRLERKYKNSFLAAKPSKLNISSSITKANENIELLVTNLGDESTSSIDVKFEAESPLFLISFGDSKSPALAPDQSMMVTIGILPKNVPLTGKMIGKFEFFDNSGKILLSIPYEIMMKPSNLIDVHVLIEDEATYDNSERPFVTGAEARLVNPTDGFSDTQYSLDKKSPIIFKSVPEGMYELEISAPNHIPVKMPIHVSTTDLKRTVFLRQKVIEYKPTLNENGEIELITEFDENTKLPVLFLSPSALSIDYRSDHPFSSVSPITVENRGETEATFSGTEIISDQLPFLISAPPIQSPIEPKKSWTIPITVIPNPKFSWTNSNICDGYLLPFIYSYQTGNKIFQRNVMYLARRTNNVSNKNVKICEVIINDNTVSLNPVPFYVNTIVTCNCESSTRQQCFNDFVDGTACGSLLTQIDRTPVGLGTMIWTARLVITCQAMGIDMEKMKGATSCISYLHDVCPRSTTTPSQQKSLKQFLDFFASLQTVIGTETLQLGNSNENWFPKFLSAISDLSPSGAQVNEDEITEIGSNSPDVAQFISWWNSAVINWKAGIPKPEKGGPKFVSFSDVLLLHNRTLLLNKKSKEASFSDPFQQLNSYFLPNTDKTKEIDHCASAFVVVEPAKLYENSEFRVKMQLKNELDSVLMENVRVALNFDIENDQTETIEFSTDIPKLDGIISLNGLSSIQPQQSVTIEWKVLTNVRSQLTKPVIYHLNVALSFKAKNSETTQVLSAPSLSFFPSPGLKLFYFSHSTIGPARPEPFSVIISLMNVGYCDLKDVELADTKIKLVASSDNLRMVSYRLDAISINGSKQMTSFHQKIDKIKSGATVHVLYNLTTEETALLRQFQVTPMVDGAMTPLADKRTFTVVQVVGGQLLISDQPDSGTARYLYNTNNYRLTEITNLNFVRATTATVSNGSESLKNVTATFKPSAFTGKKLYGYGKFELDFSTSNKRLTSIQRKEPASSSLPLDSVWITSTNGRDMVHLADRNLNLDSQGSPSVIYEFLFGDIVENLNEPKFTKQEYKVSIPLAAIPDSSFLKMTAKDDDKNSKITYKLYGGNGEVKVLDNQLPADKDQYCLTVVADDDGVPPRNSAVPLAVTVVGATNSDTNQKCEILTNLDERQPYSHDGDKLLFTTTTSAGTTTKQSTTETSTVQSTIQTSASTKELQTTVTPSTQPTSDTTTEQSTSTTDASTLASTTTEQSTSTVDASTLASTTEQSTSTVDASTLASTTTEQSTSTVDASTLASTTEQSTSTVETSTLASTTTEQSTSTNEAGSTLTEESTYTQSDQTTSTLETSSSTETTKQTTSLSTSSTEVSTSSPSGESTSTIDSGNIDQSPSTAQTSTDTDRPQPTTTVDGDQSTTDPDYVDISEIDEKKLREMACRLKDTKPIWGVICDLSKTVP